ncbi:TonB-dependent receptor [Siphonobacter sp. SORGH_AS_0500]|uniref:SusC/RagA family TonB-linked outer membrane protein n=1 Tax=Siphonobacter sp. SORGH_AS_0500 TaxID=1864824 RepID=UPI002862E9B2|nr:TonB-dependent receptor [Siphonobacter sp. SORGH_AS_0500]MDR6197678.1 TonB-linked SusC/RagA family outer membrane protein [Siphonobacter sp. SORGH_AS_0500]
MRRILSALKRRFNLSLLGLCCSLYAAAQTPALVKGSVLDDTGAPLMGVTVQTTLVGKTEPLFSTTDVKGIFTFTNLRAGARYTFVFSYVGFEKHTIPHFLVNAGDNNSLLVRMKPQTQSLNDLVVIGYGAQSKAKVTGVISQVKGQELSRYSASNFAQQLAGKAAGIVINDASAQPGSDPQIVIRGIGTLTAGRNPLIVVDGYPLSEGSSLNSINPQDIETIDVLKDPSSAAIYGSRAANGVILITTKKGRSDRLQVLLDVYTGFQQRSDRVAYVDAYQAAQYFTEARDWGYVSKNPSNRSESDDRATRLSKGASLRELRLNYIQPYLDHQADLTNTQWTDEVFRKGRMSNYNLSFSGSSGKTNYYVSTNFFNQDGIVINNGFKRYSAAFKLDSRLSEKATLGISMTPSYNTQNYFNNNGNQSNDPIANLYIMYPMFSPYNSDGSLAISKQIAANTPEDGALGENAVALAYKIKNKRDFFRNFGNVYLTYDLLKGLTFKTLLGGDIQSNFFDFYNPSDVGGYRTPAPKPAVAIENREFVYNYLTENTLTYANQFGQHSLDLLVGYSFQKENGSATSVTGSNIADNNLPNLSGASAFVASTNRYVWTQLSYLARAQYAYNNKYLFSATLRRDGSSRFGDDRKWGVFPSLTGGWIISNESFFPKSSPITFAKIRGSWGKSGNNQIGSYSSKSLVNAANYVFGNTLASGFAATTTANPNLSWENKTAVNLGLNLGIGKPFTMALDYYRSITKDLLLNVPVPEQSGYSSSIQNIGKIENKGLELEFSGNSLPLGALNWSFNANAATNSNKVLALAPGQQQIVSGSQSNFLTRVGGSIAELYGYEVIGVYKTQAEIDGTPHLAGTLQGDYKVADLNGDGVVDSNDRKTFGTYNPKFTYGFSSNFAYKNLEFSFSLNGIVGRKIWDQQLANQEESGEGFGVPNTYYFNNRYHPIHNPNGFLAQPNMGNFSSARRLTRSSNYFFKNADYLRLRNVQIAYTLPISWVKKAKIQGVRLYATANNLFTFTQFRGFNPDATSTTDVLTNGFSQANYPVARSYIFGLTITF